MYLSLPVAAKRLGYSSSTLLRWVKAGRLRLYRATPTSHPRVKADDIDALLQEQSLVSQQESGLDADAAWEFACQQTQTTNRYKPTLQ